MEIIFRLFLVSVLRTMTGYAAPLLDTKDAWNVFEPVIKTACSSDGGQCWRWTPISESHDITIATPEDGDISRLQSRRQIANPTPEFALKAWKDGALEEAGREVRPLLPSNKQIPTRIAKKDVFMSRNWAGGMPFSVLYMNPRPNHAITATSTASQRQEFGMATKSSTPSVEHLNYQRNRSSTSPRRQYLNIPQLFISYGWGNFGK